MTKDNILKLYKHYSNMVLSPMGADQLERQNVRRNAARAKANLEERFKTSRKYVNDPEVQELINPTKKETKTNGKKPKRQPAE